MNAAVYILNALIFGLCGVLLLRGYFRGRQRLLLWSGLCFSLLALSNFLIFVDLIVFPTQVDLYPERLRPAPRTRRAVRVEPALPVE